VTYTGASELVVTCLGTPDLEELSNTTLDDATYSPRYLPAPAFVLFKRAAAEATTTFEEVDQEDGWISQNTEYKILSVVLMLKGL
jgi:hypothetical protein